MKLKDIPQNGWFFDLKYVAQCSVQNITLRAIEDSKTISEAKSKVISEMTEIMTECAQVIQHANAMKDDRICTCKEKGSGKSCS